ncbi:MAG: hypothetical protein GY725_09835 [bacterium]|nr:hypothetical protein [bacterium]
MKSTRREEGSVFIWVVASILVIVGFASIAIDSGQIYVARTQLASASDAGALAGMQVLRAGGTMLDARAAAVRVAERNRVLNGGVQLASSDVVMGDYDYVGRVFTPGGITLAPALQVTARRTAGSGAGRLPLALGSAIGSDNADVLARSVASVGCREIVLVQDVTISFTEEIADAREALHAFVDVMASNTLPGDRLGLVIFAAESRTLAPLSPFPQSRSELDALIDSDVIHCEGKQANVAQIFPGEHKKSCDGTDQAMGINEARELFANNDSTCGGERSIVIVSDGVPCPTFGNGGHAPGGTEAGVIAAAGAAEAEGLSITPIMLYDLGADSTQCKQIPGMGALKFNNSMARGWGRPLDTPDEEELVGLLRSVLDQIPVRLVE